jgi:hypothetical protein
MMLNPSRTYFRCDACGKSMPTEGNHNDPGDGTDLCPACFQKPDEQPRPETVSAFRRPRGTQAGDIRLQPAGGSRIP